MSWIPWSNRIEEFAPIVALHRCHLFHPTQIEAFLKGNIDVRMPPFDDISISDDEFGFIPLWGYAIAQKRAFIGGLQKTNPVHRRSYLDKYGLITSDIKQSVRHQSGSRRTVYVRGHRNTFSDHAYITYWFFYLENFVSNTDEESEIEDQLKRNPDAWASHQGDWEMISLEFSDYKDPEPAWAHFSQHAHRDDEPWGGSRMHVRKLGAGKHIRVVPAIGSHANYFEATKKTLPFGYWDVASPDIEVFPEKSAPPGARSYRLVELDPVIHTWLRFPGRWGKSHWGEGGQAPTGPLLKDREHFVLLADQHHTT